MNFGKCPLCKNDPIIFRRGYNYYMLCSNKKCRLSCIAFSSILKDELIKDWNDGNFKKLHPVFIMGE